MWGQIEGKSKMEIAAEVLSTSVNALPDNQQIAFVAYGHRNEGDCRDVEFLVDVEDGTKSAVIAALGGIRPLGRTPLAYSAMQVIDSLRANNLKATIILVTDGIESCDGNICEVVQAAKAEGIDFKLHIIGFGLKPGETEQLICAANASDGQYFDAADAGGLQEVMTVATTSTVEDGPGNVSVYAVKNGESIDALARFYKPGSRELVGMVRTYGDTSIVNVEPITFDLEVTALGGSDVKPLIFKNLTRNQSETFHQTVSFDSGKIVTYASNNGDGWDTMIYVYEPNEKRALASARSYGRNPEFDINAGTYDIELRAINIDGASPHWFRGVSVAGGESISLEHDFKSGIAMIGVRSGSELIDATVNFLDPTTKKGIAGSRTYTSDSSNPRKFILSPGTYDVVVAPIRTHSGKRETFQLTIEAGKTVTKIIEY
jgi:Ca-activated chloride channel family protein